MAAVNSLFELVQARLRQIPLPYGAGLSLADALQGVESRGNALFLQLEFGYPFTIDAALTEQIQHLFCTPDALLPTVYAAVELQTNWRVGQVATVNNRSVIPGVKNIIAVASGKGGVGKSTTAVNIALALARAGAKVGILDADIYGPSQALMLGVANKRPEMHSANKMLPIRAHGLQMISMGNLVTENTPVVWRGPMVSGALQQLLNQTHWENVDYLIVDMPPGTGDIQLTLAQAVPVSGTVIVTTPQDIALADARKGIEMFRKVNIPVLGIVENMSLHICTNCGHEEAIFGTAGGDNLAKQYGVEMLGRLPLQMSICQQTDSGNPPVVAEPDSVVTSIYCEIAAKVGALLWEKTLYGNAAPTISISDD